MALDDDQKHRVSKALETGLLEDLKSPEEIHQFILNYNVNDGFNPIWFAVRSPLCDKGTALYAYWLFDQIILSPLEERQVEPRAEWDAAGLIIEIERLFTSGFYANQNIFFDPRSELEWTQEEDGRFRAGEFSFPGEMLEATPGRSVEREQF